MNTSVEKGLASHSSIMVAPQELSGDNEEGWTVVSSKRILEEIEKDLQATSNKQQKVLVALQALLIKKSFKLPLKTDISSQEILVQVSLALLRDP